MIRGAIAICCECAKRLDVVEPFTGGVRQLIRCAGCGMRLLVGRVSDGWEVRTLAEFKGERTAPLPAVASVRQFVRNACVAVARMLSRGGVEPGEANLRGEIEGRP